MNSSASRTRLPPRADLHAKAAAALDALAPGGAPVALAVSGGSDSIGLLHLAHRWAAGGRPLIVATVDHGLRAAAADEAAGVAGVCARLGLAHEVLSWRPPGPSASQAAARDARHRLLAAWAMRHGAAAIALAHTADDRAETFLIRIAAGSGWRGLSGPAPSAPSPAWPAAPGPRLIRPLLALDRRDIRSWLGAIGAAWMEDPSNLDERFTRVRARARLARLGEPARADLLSIMNRLGALREAATGGAREAADALIAEGGGAFCLPAGVYRSLGGETRRRLLEALLSAIGGATAPLRSDRLARTDSRLLTPGGVGAGAAFAGVVMRERRSALVFAPAPAARGQASRFPGAQAALARLNDLLSAERFDLLG